MINPEYVPDRPKVMINGHAHDFPEYVPCAESDVDSHRALTNRNISDIHELKARVQILEQRQESNAIDQIADAFVAIKDFLNSEVWKKKKKRRSKK